MPYDVPGHDVRDENRNTENFAKGVDDHAPNDAAARGMEVAGGASGRTPDFLAVAYLPIASRILV